MDPGDKDREIRRLKINANTRKSTRELILKTWISEEPETKYRYNVENIDGKWIYVRRPAPLNKGCDFKIYVEEWLHYKNGNEKPPSHDDVLSDLKNKFEEDENKYEELEEAINQVYNCKSVDEIINNVYPNLESQIGLNVETLLKLIKWFFIEQDITDWNYSGREMFMNAIRNVKKQ